MGAESQALWTFGSQHDLVISIRQVNLRKTIPTTQLPHQIFRKWHRVTIGFQLMVDCNRVVPANPKFSSFSCYCCLANGGHRSPISTELSRLSNSSSNPSIIGLAEFVLDSKGDHTRPAKDWLYLWLKFYLKLEIFYAPKFRLEKICKLLAELLA